MARPEKVGHDYFSFYTNPEKREEFGIIFSQKGTEGYVTILELECLIRGDYGEGYYVKGNDATLSKLQDRTKCVTMNKIKEILEYAVKIDYFDKKLFLKHKIITNKRIQFDHVYNSQRRNNLMIKKDYMLLTDEDLYIGGIKRKLTLEKGYFQWVNVSNNSINVDINSINVSNNSVNVSEKCNNKIKENKIKENESKLNEIKLDKIDSESNGNSVSNSESEIEFSSLHVVVQQLILENFLNIGKDPLYIYELNDFCFELNQKEGYAVKKIRKAGLAVIRTMKEKRDNPTPAPMTCFIFSVSLFSSNQENVKI